MHAYIITGADIVTRSNYVSSQAHTQIELLHITAEKSSITIKQIQDLSPPLSISPRLPRHVWIEEADRMTVPAQNALLKMLEEPPSDTTFYLTCASSTSLLPTIRSRALVVQLATDSHDQDPSILAELKTIMAMSPGDRLSSIVKRDRTQSIAWMTQIEQGLRDKLSDPSLASKSTTMLAKIARLALDCHSQLMSNCSISLATQNFYLLLPKIK